MACDIWEDVLVGVTTAAVTGMGIDTCYAVDAVSCSIWELFLVTVELSVTADAATPAECLCGLWRVQSPFLLPSLPWIVFVV